MYTVKEITEKVLNKLIQHRSKFYAIVLSVALVALAFCCQVTCFYKMMNKATIALAPLTRVDSIQHTILSSTCTDSTLKLQTIKNQFAVCQEIKTYYKTLSLWYYANYYSFSICSIIMTLLVSIGVFLVALQGWETSPLPIKTLTLTAIILASFYYLLPNVLKNEENFKENITKVKIFQKIQFDILSFSNNSCNASKAQVDSVVTVNYFQISTNYDFLTAIDNSKISNDPQQVLKTLNK